MLQVPSHIIKHEVNDAFFAVTQSESERSCILLLRLQTHDGSWIWCHTVIQVKDGANSSSSSGGGGSSGGDGQSTIVCTNQILT